MKFKTLSFLSILHALSLACGHTRTNLRGGIDEALQYKQPQYSRVLLRSTDGTPSFVTGHLGTIEGFDSSHDNKRQLAILSSASGEQVLSKILSETFGAAGDETMKTVKKPIERDDNGNVHLRYQEFIQGVPVEGAAMVMHLTKNGTVYAVNGEFVSSKNLPLGPEIDAETALNIALEQLMRQTDQEFFDIEWLGVPELSIVYGFDGQGHRAWKNLLSYRFSTGPTQKDVIFADAQTGELVARHPQVFSFNQRPLLKGPSVLTQDCRDHVFLCKNVSDSSVEISTGDELVDSAHNNAIATYNYFFKKFGRDSIDGEGMTMVSRVRYDLNNAFWDGAQVTYGRNYPLDVGVVAHEFMHGITQWTSNLVYFHEPGALNEGMSDIFGAAVDREEGATIDDAWLLGDDAKRNGIRNMRDPESYGGSDHYDTRYIGSEDNSGVHINSGIVNLAFVLLVEGGVHPRSKTSIRVDPIDGLDFDRSLTEAARIFYMANTACLTPASNFAAARYCTADIHGGSHSEKVHKAWDAVGVPNEPPPTSMPSIELMDGQVLTGQSLEKNAVQEYLLHGVQEGEMVNCKIDGSNGDADLYVLFEPRSSLIECTNLTNKSVEECTTGATTGASTAQVLVHAYDTFTNLSITCSTIRPTVLENEIPVMHQSRTKGELAYYVLPGIKTDMIVLCSLFGDNGNADLYVRFNVAPFTDPEHPYDDCTSYESDSNEQCYTMPAPFSTSAYVVLSALEEYSDLTLVCRALGPE